jgi:tight adherence protein B
VIGRVRALAAARHARDDAVAVDRVAGVAERLAVLLSAGVPAPAAWRHLSADAPADAVLAAAADAAAEGESVAAALALATVPAAPRRTGRRPRLNRPRAPRSDTRGARA